MAELSAAVRGFLYENVDSYEQLEALLFMHARTSEAWSAEAVGRATGVDTAAAEQALRGLAERGLCNRHDTPTGAHYRYTPASPVVAALVGEVARAYDTDRLAVVHAMATNSIDRVRHRAMRMFADAFVLGRKKDD